MATQLQKLKVAARARGEKYLKKLGWTTDKVFWYNPRSGYRYTYEAALNIEELRRSRIQIYPQDK
jgi:hypothetical protein